MRIEINGKTWYDVADFTDYEEIEELGEITGTSGIPDCVDIESDWDSIQEYLTLSEAEQAIMIAYAEVTDCFDWSEAQDAYVGSYADGAEFAQELCEELEYEALRDTPSYLWHCIDWECVWLIYLRHDYFESNGYYFRNV